MHWRFISKVIAWDSQLFWNAGARPKTTRVYRKKSINNIPIHKSFNKLHGVCTVCQHREIPSVFCYYGPKSTYKANVSLLKPYWTPLEHRALVSFSSIYSDRFDVLTWRCYYYYYVANLIKISIFHTPRCKVTRL